MAGGGGTPTSGGKTNQSDRCEDLSLSTNVTTPDEQLFLKIKEKDVLEVRLVEGEKVCLFDSEGILLGSVLDPKVTLLVKCLKLGKKFIGIITKIDEAFIAVEIYCIENE